MRPDRFLRRFTLGALCTLLWAGTASAQQAAVSGRVTDAGTGQPVVAAQVSIVGSNLGGQTSADGVYTIRGVTPGTVTVRVLSIGYSERTQQTTVAAGQTATLNFELPSTAIGLNPVVVTATGEQRRIEVGNSIAQVNASQIVETRAVSNMADLLTARAAGVQVIPGTQTGAGTRVRIRGNSSISLSNNPIYIVDGVRVEGTTGSASISVGGTTPARINDINPDEIESIEIVRGPSAATLYGTDAANGVVVIRTKRGVAGRTQWTYYTEQTAIRDRNNYPTSYHGWTTGSTRMNTTQCYLTQVVSGACVQDSVTSFNVTEDPETTPFGTGYRQQQGLQLRGGSEAVRFFVHGEWETENGPARIPDFDQRWLDRNNVTLTPEQRRPNGLSRLTGRANMDIDISPQADLSISTGYTSQDLRLIRSDDSGVPGLATNIYGGWGYRYMQNPSTGDTLFGYRTVTPREIYGTTTNQRIERVISSVASNYRPLDWVNLRANVGLDYAMRHETQLCRFGECPVSGTDHLGFKRDNRSNFYLYTIDGAASATRQFSSEIEGRTTLGVQYTRNVFNRNGIFGRELPPGAQTVTAAAIITNADETTTESRTLGGYLEQHVAIRDRLFLTGAVRSDRNSAFGADFETVFYPKFAVSWVVSEEPFFPFGTTFDQLRLRMAYGASGVQPGTTAALQYYSTATALGESGEMPGLIFTALGNRELKPERSTEIELGADLTLFSNRLSAELTYYDKTSRDALISRGLPPSVGTGNTSRFENLGEVRNWGWEAMLHAQIVQTRNFGWDVLINGSTNSNELVSLGDAPPIVGATLRTVEGFPLNGWWNRRIISYEPSDPSGILAPGDLVLSDTAEFHGYSMPRHEVAFTTGVDFLNRQLRLAGMMDYKGGHLVYNNSERIRCSGRNVCSGLINPESSLREQAASIAVRSFATQAGYFEKGDFLRLRELSLTYFAPADLVSRMLRGRSLTATLGVRNLGMIWTEYTGVDPEAFGTTGDSPSSFQAFAPPTYFSFRLSLGF